MEKRVYRLFVVESLVASGATTPNNLAIRELGIYGRDMATVGASADTSIVHLVQGTGNTTDKAPLWSHGIKARKVTSLTRRNYVAPAAQVTTITMPTPVLGDEYTLRIVYKHNVDYWSCRQETQTFTVVVDSTITTAAQLADAFAAQITELDTYEFHKFRTHVLATSPGAPLVLTGKDETVLFECFMFKNIEQEATGATITLTTPQEIGNGTYRQVYAMEDYQKGYYGFTNRVMWPVLTPEYYSQSGKCYDIIVLEYFNVSDTGSVGTDAYVYSPMSVVIAVDNSVAGLADDIMTELTTLFPDVTPAF